MDQEKVIKVLKCMHRTTWNVARYYEQDGETLMANNLRREAMGISTAICLLTNDEIFQKMCEMYNVE